MYLQDLVNSGPVPALEKMLAFTEARQRVLSENIANVDTPGYQTRQLDAAEFQQALRRAIDAKKCTGSDTLPLERGHEFGLDGCGRLEVRPSEDPAENVLFHDETNVRIERQMALMAENAMMHQAVAELLKGRFETLLKAISGRV